MSKRKSKQRESMVMALRSLGNEPKNPLLIQCGNTAKAYANRVLAAKTESERDAIRAEFDRWSETDPTFKRLVLGVKTLLCPPSDTQDD
jgi:hypothetical protein